MSNPDRKRLVRLVRACDGRAILAASALCTGHAILAPGALLHAGLPRDVVEHLTVTHRSDGTLKGTLYAGGRRVPRLRGVSGLALLRFLAAALGVSYPRALGRGREADNIRQALHRHFSTAPDASPAAAAGDDA